MFTHQGKSRTLTHNLRIASLLSFVAGIVNVAGFLAVAKLTTNVTGHFAFFVDEIFKLHFWNGFVYFLYIFFFFLGSFVSSYLVELIAQKTERNIYVLPTSIEILILFSIGIFGGKLILNNPNIIACSLLFAMGLQNSLVTKISNATVRTTHLTGLFTDLGIELSQLFFFKKPEMKKKLYSSIKLRLTIICFFFIGGIIGGILYVKIKLVVLLIAAIALVFGLIYDNIKLKILLLNRKYNH
ncbi:YoaK family protein [Flavobacterium paronense]|uniref:YoaK family protein n=1 Tax=Flavobacterium paronense TaxID=1392775 RepID=A0ABV5GCG8_9FLAO|nr:YoaK family protein [Flavobacterium paronense]MDN3677922.1 YoaK family protein [Flavobacterium paronense]